MDLPKSDDQGCPLPLTQRIPLQACLPTPHYSSAVAVIFAAAVVAVMAVASRIPVSMTCWGSSFCENIGCHPSQNDEATGSHR